MGTQFGGPSKPTILLKEQVATVCLCMGRLPLHRFIWCANRILSWTVPYGLLQHPVYVAALEDYPEATPGLENGGVWSDRCP